MSKKEISIADQILVMDCQSGDSAALDELVKRWQKKFWRYAFRLSSNAEAAWEITQESWIGIIKGINRLEDPANFVAWAYRIVTNKSYDWIKQKIKKHQFLDEFDIFGDKDNYAELKDNKNDIEIVLKKMPVESRTVLCLYYLDELDISDISGVLNIPKGTVKSRLYKARGEFKKYWQKNTK